MLFRFMKRRSISIEAESFRAHIDHTGNSRCTMGDAKILTATRSMKQDQRADPREKLGSVTI